MINDGDLIAIGLLRHSLNNWRRENGEKIPFKVLKMMVASQINFQKEILQRMKNDVVRGYHPSEIVIDESVEIDK